MEKGYYEAGSIVGLVIAVLLVLVLLRVLGVI